MKHLKRFNEDLNHETEYEWLTTVEAAPYLVEKFKEFGKKLSYQHFREYVADYALRFETERDTREDGNFHNALLSAYSVAYGENEDDFKEYYDAYSNEYDVWRKSHKLSDINSKTNIFENVESVTHLLSPEEAAPYLMDMSSEQLSKREFHEYVADYAKNPLDYSIDISSKYYQAIVTAYEKPSSCYDAYVKEFEPWRKSDKLDNANDKTNIFENLSWRSSKKLKKINRNTGIFDEEGIEQDLADFEDALDESFEKLFDSAFGIAQERGLFGGNFADYMDARESQYSDKHFSKEYNDLKREFEHFKSTLIDDLRDPD